jgi:hypothetical protein
MQRRFLGQVGPLPYDHDPADTRACPNCTLMNSPDSAVCDQCGEDMPGAAGDYLRRDGDDVVCHHCESYNAPDAQFCRRCGHPIPRQAYVEEAESDWNTPQMTTSSSGRRDQPAYRAFLEHQNDLGRELPEGERDGFLHDLAQAEDAMRLTDQDVADRMADMQYAAHQIDTEHLGERDLDPWERHRYVELLGTTERWERAVAAAERARRRYYRLAERFNEIANPPKRTYPEGWFGE